MKELIKNTFIEKLSGIADYHEDGGIKIKNGNVSVFFPTNSPLIALIRGYANNKMVWKKECDNDNITFTHYHDNGNERTVESRDGDDKKHGKSLSWYEDGTKHWDEQYEHGKPYGCHYMWHRNGVLMKKLNYINGFLENDCVEYFDNGNKKAEYAKVNGKIDGVNIHYYENGNKWYSQEYKNNKKNGKYIKWDWFGNECEIGIYKDGKKHGVYTFLKDGKETKKIIYENDKKIKEVVL